MTPLWRNPEFIRNCRAQLRPRRLLLVASIIAALSLVVGYSAYQSYTGPDNWGTMLFLVAFYSQVFTLCLGGAYYCLHAISSERAHNTFDFQRVTQLSSLELALGKLFGAPSVAWFATLCMLPATLVGALVGGISPLRLAAGYLILFTGALAVHALFLLASLAAARTSGGVAGLVAVMGLLLLIVFSGSQNTTRLFFDLGAVSPAAAVEFARQGTWRVVSGTAGIPPMAVSHSDWTDVFFGIPVHHLPVLLILYLSFAVWCLLPLARNLKKDRALLELFSPAQSVGLLVYLDVILVGFFLVYHVYYSGARAEQTAASTFGFFLTLNLALLYGLGLALIRNREQVRRRAHQRIEGRADWTGIAWPAAYLLVGAASAAVIYLSRFGWRSTLVKDLDPRFALFACGLLFATMLRDICFLQWMNLRRSNHPLMMGAILLGVFYFCGGILLEMAKFTDSVKTAFTAIVAPWPLAAAGSAEQAAWSHNPAPWFVGLAVQLALVVLFAALHYKSTGELRPAPIARPASAEAAGD